MKSVLKPGTVIAAVALAGCAGYHAKPLDPVRTEAAFLHRSLSDPGLRAYLAAQTAAVRPGADPVLDLRTLTLVAFYYNPALDTARARLDLASAGIVTAGTVPNPSVSIPPTYETPVPAGVTPFAIFGPSFDIPIETTGKRTYRVAKARRLSRAAFFDLMAARWQVRSRVRAALAAYLLARQMLEVRRAEEKVRSELAAVFEKSLAVGQVSRPALIAARGHLLDARLAVRTAETAVIDGRSALAAALGVPVGALHGATIAWPGLEHPPAPASLAPGAVQAAGLLNRYDVRAALADYTASESALRLEIAKQYPDIHLGPQYQFEQNTNKWTLGVTLALPIFNQNQGPIAEAEAKRQQAAASFTGLQARVIGETARALAQYRAAIAGLADADAALALVREREAASRRLLETGEGDRLSLLGDRLQRIIAERGRLDALRGVQNALGALEDAVQRPLGDEPRLPPIPLRASPTRKPDDKETTS